MKTEPSAGRSSVAFPSTTRTTSPSLSASWRAKSRDRAPVQDAPYALGPLERELVMTKLQLGRVLLDGGRIEEAVAAWRDALRLDPQNFTIRKQIWVAEHPEKFFPTIDFAWQQEQLAAEREREIADGVCGPDGCPMPWPSAQAKPPSAGPGV